MAQISRQAGTTGHITHIFVQDTSRTDGGGLTGLTNASSGLVCAYKRNKDAAAVAVTLDAIVALGTYGTYAAGHAGFKEVDAALWPGLYEFQVPNAAMIAGAGSVAFSFKGATNMASTPLFIELTGVNNQDGVAGGMSALPNANAGAASGLFVLDASAHALVYSVSQPVTAGTVSDKAGYALAIAPPTLAQVVNGVWDEPKSSHTTAGSFGLLVGANLDAAVSSRSTYAGGPVASVTAPVTVGTNNDKGGYLLAAAGVDAISIEAGVNLRQSLSPILAAAAGTLSGAGTGTIVIKGGNVTTTRITAATDASGNRSSVALTLPT